MKKKFMLIFMVSILVIGSLAACGKKEETNVVVPEQAEKVIEVTEEVEGTKIMPLPTTVDMNALDNCTLAVSFEKGDAYVDDTGAMQLDVTVYTYDLYDMVDISNLKKGDIIVIQGNDVVVETLETLESGLIYVNGGMENGGYDLWNADSGVYFEHGFNDTKSYYALGKATIKVSADFKFIDASDLDKGEVTYYPGDFLTEDAGIIYNFTPNNTSIVVEDGQVIQMTRIFTP